MLQGCDVIYYDVKREFGDNRIFYRDGGESDGVDVISEYLSNGVKRILVYGCENGWIGQVLQFFGFYVKFFDEFIDGCDGRNIIGG